ncbi:MAG: hypothetical protein K2P49_09290, partial [Oscillospiraceae bacterium]|nr:hypothetical protein [Oscillospiraceae bacterium]
EGFSRQARRIFAGILCVLQENSTQHVGKRPAQTAFEVVNTGSKTPRFESKAPAQHLLRRRFYCVRIGGFGRKDACRGDWCGFPH